MFLKKRAGGGQGRGVRPKKRILSIEKIKLKNISTVRKNDAPLTAGHIIFLNFICFFIVWI
jgi:hypothetical protein